MLSSSLAFMSLLSDEVVMKQNRGGRYPEYGVEWGGGAARKDAKEEDCNPKTGTLKSERKRSAPASALSMGFQLLLLLLIKYKK